MKYICTTFLCFLTICVFAQTQDTISELKIGDWRSYLSFQEGRYVTQSKDKVFFASKYAIATLDKQDDSFDYITKVEGLNDAGIQLIRYNSFAKVLIVIYVNSNIDLVYDSGEVVNIKDIENNTDIIGDKKVYDIFMANSKDVYMACGFGILKLNLERKEFSFTTFTKGKRVNGITVFENSIYAATNQGVYVVKNDEKNINIADFAKWSLLGTAQGFPSNYGANAIINYGNRLYVGLSNAVVEYKNATQTLRKIYSTPGTDQTIKYMTAEGKNLLVGIECGSCNGHLLFINSNGDLLADQYNDCLQRVQYAVEDEKGQIWLADDYEGYRRMKTMWSACETLPKTNTPYSSEIGELATDGKNLWVASGGVLFNGNYATNPNGVYHLQDGIWSYYNRTVKGETVFGANNVLNCNRVAVHPVTKKAYIASMFRGVLEIDPTTRKTKLFDTINTKAALQYGIGDYGQIRVTGLVFDKKNNLWISNNLAEKPIVVMKADGTWAKMGSVVTAAPIYQVAIDNNGYKWFVIGQGDGGIIVFDEGKLIDSEADDRIMTLKVGNSNLPSNRINCIEKDLNGQMWVGTDKGIAVFQCSDNVFAEKCKAYLPTVQVDGIADYLLRLENVQCIAIDGANRKWFGTSNGIFVQSASGRTNIANFNKNNSPLADNNIIDIAISDETGEVFIATEKGLQSLKGDALAGKAVHSNVLAYPNPVRPDYDGPIAIKGLARNANVKITDANGALVLDTQALGGQLVWDGRDYSNRKVAPGVYLVFSASNDTENIDTAVAKILIMR